MALAPISVAGADEQAIALLLKSTTCDIESIFSFTSDEFYNEGELRKRYRKIALLIHPDKSKNHNAESAFKILTNALEVLLTRLSDATNRSFSASGDCTSSDSRETKCTSNAVPSRENDASDNRYSYRHREKDFSCPDARTKNTKDEGKSSNFTEIRKCREAEMTKMRENWAAAEKSFFLEILKTRVEKEVRKKRKRIEKDEIDRDRAVSLEEECFERQKDIESRSNNWKLWSEKQKKSTINLCNSSSTSDGTISSNVDVTHQKIRINGLISDSGCSNYYDHSNKECSASNHEKTVCLICQRSFSSFEALVKHENFSQLHQRNLVRTDT